MTSDAKLKLHNLAIKMLIVGFLSWIMMAALLTASLPIEASLQFCSAISFAILIPVLFFVLDSKILERTPRSLAIAESMWNLRISVYPYLKVTRAALELWPYLTSIIGATMVYSAVACTFNFFISEMPLDQIMGTFAYRLESFVVETALYLNPLVITLLLGDLSLTYLMKRKFEIELLQLKPSYSNLLALDALTTIALHRRKISEAERYSLQLMDHAEKMPGH